VGKTLACIDRCKQAARQTVCVFGIRPRERTLLLHTISPTHAETQTSWLASSTCVGRFMQVSYICRHHVALDPHDCLRACLGLRIGVRYSKVMQVAGSRRVGVLDSYWDGVSHGARPLIPPYLFAYANGVMSSRLAGCELDCCCLVWLIGVIRRLRRSLGTRTVGRWRCLTILKCALSHIGNALPRPMLA
jgi:hypothetical protein